MRRVDHRDLAAVLPVTVPVAVAVADPEGLSMAWWELGTGLHLLRRSSAAAITYWAAAEPAVAELSTCWGYLEMVAAVVTTLFAVLLLLLRRRLDCHLVLRLSLVGRCLDSD